MFGDILKSVVEVTSDVVKVVAAPVEIALDVTKAVVKPIAEVAEEIVKDVKDSLDQEVTTMSCKKCNIRKTCVKVDCSGCIPTPKYTSKVG